MKLLIAYATKTGTARDCAEMLGSHFEGHEVVLADLEGEMPPLSDFDAVVIGSHVRAGRIHKRAKQFAAECEGNLGEKPLGLYLCCCFGDAAEDYFKKNYSQSLLERSVANLFFGGEIRMERQKGIDKLIMKIAVSAIKSNNRDEDRETDIPLPAIVPENVRRMADAIKGAI